MSTEYTASFGSAALKRVSTWYWHVFRIALKGMHFWWIKLPCLSNPPSVTSIWRWGLKLIFFENGCNTTMAPAVNLPPLLRYEIVSLIATIAASIKTFRRERLFFTTGHRASGIVSTACRWGTLNNAFWRDLAHLSAWFLPQFEPDTTVTSEMDYYSQERNKSYKWIDGYSIYHASAYENRDSNCSNIDGIS